MSERPSVYAGSVNTFLDKIKALLNELEGQVLQQGKVDIIKETISEIDSKKADVVALLNGWHALQRKVGGGGLKRQTPCSGEEPNNDVSVIYEKVDEALKGMNQLIDVISKIEKKLSGRGCL